MYLPPVQIWGHEGVENPVDGLPLLAALPPSSGPGAGMVVGPGAPQLCPIHRRPGCHHQAHPPAQPEGQLLDHPCTRGSHTHPAPLQSHLCSSLQVVKKAQDTGRRNTFSNDWSPPPVGSEPEHPTGQQGDPAPGPRALRRLAYQHPEVSRAGTQDLDRLRGLVSLGAVLGT